MQDNTRLTAIAEATTVLTADRFSFAGKVFTEKMMTGVIYEQCYCRHFDGHYHETGMQGVPSGGDGEFIRQLSAANNSTEKWDKDWLIEQVLPSGQFVANKHGKYKFVYPGEFVSSGYRQTMPKEGTSISVYQPKESKDLQTAFYFVFGDEPAEQGLLTLVRLYWHLKSEGATGLVAGLSKALNQFAIPFTLKCLNHPALFIRSDAAVLYVSKAYFPVTAQIIAGLYPKFEPGLHSDVPLFTKPLAPGLSVAEDPGTGESFGMSRCALVAQGLYDAFYAGVTDTAGKIASIRKVFETKGISISSPNLNAGSKDIYHLPVNQTYSYKVWKTIDSWK